MSSSHVPPISKTPMERTLLVAVTLLTVVAVVQVVAAALALAPRIDFEKWARSMAPRPAASDTAAPAPAVPPEAAQAKAAELVAEAKTFREAGNFQGALEAVTEADRLLPNNIGILALMASFSSQLGKTADLIAVCKRIVALPPSNIPEDAATRTAAQQVLARAPATAQAPVASAQAVPMDAAGAHNDVGIDLGSVMGIVDVKLLDGEPGQKNLRVSTKAASGQKIDATKFQATVDFYEQDDQGQIVHNDSPHPPDWLSGPQFDWANGDPEIFQIKYRLPLADRGDLPPLQYYGYVVAIYYNGELQAQRAEPVSLLDQYAPPLHRELPAE